MTGYILSHLGRPAGPFSWEVVLVLVLLIVIIGLIDLALSSKLGALWRLLLRRHDKKKAAPEGGRLKVLGEDA